MILDYIFIGFVFTFIVDLLMGLKPIINHPKMKDKVWWGNERIICILFWPIAFTIFTVQFIKSYFR